MTVSLGKTRGSTPAARRRKRETTPPPPRAPSRHERAEHAGRVPQPGIPSGPRQTVAPTPRAARIIHHEAAAQRRRSTAQRVRRSATKRRRRAVRLDARAKQTARAVTAATREIKAVARPERFQGKPTAGTPTRRTLRREEHRGTLKVNKAGAVTTQPVRKAARRLKKVEAAAPRGTHDVAGIEDPEIRHAIKKYGHRVDPIARGYGLDSGEELLSKLVKGESNESQTVKSSADAKSITQFIPETREDFVNRFGIDPWRSKDEAVLAATMHLDGKHGYSPGLEGYNPGGGQGYVDYILEQDVGGPAKSGVKATKAVRKARRAAERLGLHSPGAPKAKVTKKTMSRYKAAVRTVKALAKANIPYRLGGGHGSFESHPSTLDCSGAVSYVLHKMGVLNTPLVSGDMGQVLKPGPGAVTVFYNAGHTFMYIAGYGFWGTSAGDSGAGGLGKHPDPGADYLSQYSVGHVPGLGKNVAVALGLGGVPSGGGSMEVPGMVMGEGDTTATIAPGAGTKKVKPGFSTRPLTPTQVSQRKMKRLASLGVGEDAEQAEGPSTETLSRLERKYKVAA